jgi:hypothetical protein
MTANEKIHIILKYVLSVDNQSGFDTDQIANAINLPLAETNVLVRQIIDNGDAGGYSTKDTSAKGAIGLLKNVETKDAYETNKYLNEIAPQEIRYNIFIKTQTATYNILNQPESKLSIVLNAYLKGKTTFTISGKKYWMNYLLTIKIYTHEKQIDFVKFRNFCKPKGYWKRSIIGSYFTIKALKHLGKDVTDEFIGDTEFGEMAKTIDVVKAKPKSDFVNNSRLEELKSINHPNFDMSKLIRLCEELNDSFNRGNYLSVGMIGRTVLNHIPPIFGFTKFDQVANNYGGSSFKKNTQHLNVSLRSIADSFLHETIRNKETLPNDTQVDFRQDLDRLLEEIVRLLKK